MIIYLYIAECVLSRPQTKEELFNLHHASACNIVEQIIGILKQQWGILQLTPPYNMNIQILIPQALCALHNFIHRYDPDYLQTFEEVSENWYNPFPDGDLATGPADCDEAEQANAKHDEIAQQMWNDYVALMAARERPA